MIGKTMLGVILAIGLSMVPAFAEIDTPYKQFQNGTPLEQIQCRDSKVLMETNRAMPACVNDISVEKMTGLGWNPVQQEKSDDLEMQLDEKLEITSESKPAKNNLDSTQSSSETGSPRDSETINMITTGSPDGQNKIGELGFEAFPHYTLTFPEQVIVGDQFDVVLDYTFVVPSVRTDENGLESPDYTNYAKKCLDECMDVIKNRGSEFHVMKNSFVDLQNDDDYVFFASNNDTRYLPIREFDHGNVAPIFNNTHPQQKT